MKKLLAILGASAVFFIAVSMAQEWQVFATTFFGSRPEAPLLDPADREEAERALRHYLTLTKHLYRSDGDERFLERLPASPPVREELMADILYLRRNGRHQDPTLQELGIEDVGALGPDTVEISTWEHWIIRTLSLADGTDTDPVLSGISHCRYLMEREAAGWIVKTWELTSAPPEPETERSP